MSTASDFVREKLGDFQQGALERVARAVMVDISHASKNGAYQGSARALMVQRTLVASYRSELESMAKVLIATESYNDPDAIAALAEAAATLEQSFRPDLVRHAEIGSIKLEGDALSKVSERVVKDVQRRIIGVEAYKAEHVIPAINVTAQQAAVAVGSPGATLQVAGRDAARSTHTIDVEAVRASIESLRDVISTATISDQQKQELRAAVEMVAAPATMDKSDPSAIRVAYDWLRSKADTTVNSAIGAGVTTLARLLFG